MKKLLNMKKKEKPIRTPKEKPKKEARMPKIKREKPKRQPKSKNQNPSVKKLPKPVSVVWEWLKWLHNPETDSYYPDSLSKEIRKGCPSSGRKCQSAPSVLHSDKIDRLLPHPGYVDRNIGNCFLFPILRGLE